MTSIRLLSADAAIDLERHDGVTRFMPGHLSDPT